MIRIRGDDRPSTVIIPVSKTGTESMANYTVHLWRLQRAVRAFLRRRMEQRALAVAMGVHARLGRSSAMADLPADVLGEIFVKCF